VSTSTLAWGVALLLAGWLTLLVRLRRVYVQSLVQTLEQRRLDFANASFEVKDESTLKTLANAMKASRIGDVLHALELLANVPARARESLDGEVSALLSHASADVRVAALRVLALTPDKPDNVEVIAQRVDDAEPMVRAAAVQALTAIQRENASDLVSSLLTDPDVGVRAATVAGLIRHGGLDGVVRSAGELKAMTTSEDYRARERAAWILGEVGVATFYQPLVPLLKDSDVRVRRAAIEAAGKLASPQLIDALVEALSAPRLAGTAVNALVRVGPRGEEAAAKLLANDKADREGRLQATRVLARFTDGASVAALTSQLDATDPRIRTAVVKALLRLEAADVRLVMNVKAVRKTLRDEARRYFELLAAERDVGSASPLLADALKHRLRTTRERILGLVALLGRDASVDAAIRNLASSKAAVRGNALEVLDNLLEKDDKNLVIPVVDDTTVEQKLEIAASAFKLPRLSRDARVKTLLTSGDTWLVTCSAIAAADMGIQSLISDVEAARESADQVCREAAMLAVARLNAKRPSMNVAS
ncbi:MAG TPA: HEAT repeat domain-containing protein, partial [Myxococcota bacterium]|nr:HEAT repeat domain-containing protein [Myxococcota bacterium]